MFNKIYFVLFTLLCDKLECFWRQAFTAKLDKGKSLPFMVMCSTVVGLWTKPQINEHTRDELSSLLHNIANYPPKSFVNAGS